MYIYKLVPRPPTFKTGSTPLLAASHTQQRDREHPSQIDSIPDK